MRTANTMSVVFVDLPKLSEIDQFHYGVNSLSIDVDPFANWHVLAWCPLGMMYGSQDDEALDETNWDVCHDAMLASSRDDEMPTVQDSMNASYQWSTIGTDEALASGVAMLGRCGLLIFDPDNEDALDAAQDITRSISDYPLLDESAYSEREWEAWQEYAPTALDDEIRDARRNETLDETVIDYIEDNADDLLPTLAQEMHYSYGFSGEYFPQFLDIFVSQRNEKLRKIYFPNETDGN